MIRQRRKRPQINRRVRPSARQARERFLLDVNVRHKTAKRIRTRRISSWVWKFSMCLVLIVGSAVLIQTLLERCFLENSTYNLSKVETRLGGILTEEEVLRLSGIEKGQNVFKIDLSRAERKLEVIDDIISARFSRKLPETISIELEIRQPIAWVVESSSTNSSTPPEQVVDSSGYIYKPYRILANYYHLPVLYGIDRKLLANNDPLEKDALRKSIELISTCQRMTNSTLQIQSVDVSKGYCIDVIDNNHARITFDTSDFKEQLERLQKLLDYCQETGRELETVNLIPKRNTPVRFHQITPAKVGLQNTGYENYFAALSNQFRTPHSELRIRSEIVNLIPKRNTPVRFHQITPAKVGLQNTGYENHFAALSNQFRTPHSELRIQ